MFREISVEELTQNPFTSIGGEHMLVSAGNSRGFNAATTSWGALGRLWDKPVVTVYLRSQGATIKYMDAVERFAVSVFDPKHRDALLAGGINPGRRPRYLWAPFAALMTFVLSIFGYKERLRPMYITDVIDAVTFTQASMVLICKKLYRAPLDEGGLTTEGEEYCSNGIAHTLYVGELLKVLIKMDKYTLDRK